MKKKKNSALRKLVPATCMLLVSATMLASSTYAWFTMSKEVEVKGINLTASVPEDIQVSLGNGQATGDLDATISTASGVTLNRLTAVAAPGNDDSDPDWSNSVSVADFYQFGRLTPATSVDGLNMYYTSQATGVGKSLAGQMIQDGTIIGPVNTSQFQSATGLTAAVAEQGGTLTDSYSNTGAYYIDIPVWFRTSTSGTVNLGVEATVSNQTNPSVNFEANSAGSRSNSETDDLYKSVRVSILEGSGTTPAGTTNSTAQGILTSSNWTTGSYYGESATYQRPLVGQATWSGSAWSGINTVDKFSTTDGTTGFATDGTTLVTMSGSTTEGKTYGDAVRYTIRVWIEGEDVNCWNATAGQNFTVSLRFLRQNAQRNTVTTATTTSATITPLPTSEDVTISVGTGTLTLTKSTASDSTVTWSVSSSNTFYMAPGSTVSYNSDTNTYNTLDALVAALNAANITATPTVTYTAP